MLNCFSCVWLFFLDHPPHMHPGNDRHYVYGFYGKNSALIDTADLSPYRSLSGRRLALAQLTKPCEAYIS